MKRKIAIYLSLIVFLFLTGCGYRGNVAHHPFDGSDPIEHVFDGPVLLTSAGNVVIPRSSLFRPDEDADETGETASPLVQIDKLSKIVKIVYAEDRTFALKENGQVWYWGVPWDHDIMGGLVAPVYPQVRTAEKFPHISHVADMWGSGGGIVFKKEDGTVWGWNTSNCHVSDAIETEPSIRAYPWLDDAVEVFTCLTELKSDGTVWESGEDANQKVEGLQDIISIQDHNYALDRNGKVWTWGNVSESYPLAKGIHSSPLTDGVITLPYPIEVTDHVIQISGSFALKEDGSVWNLDDPSKIEGLNDIKEIGGYYQFVVALATDGRVYTKYRLGNVNEIKA